MSKMEFDFQNLCHIILYGNTPGTAGGPGGRDRTLAVKSLKNPIKII